MKAVFADAFYFVARLNRHDQHHEPVVAFSRSFRARFVTTDWVPQFGISGSTSVASCASDSCQPR